MADDRYEENKIKWKCIKSLKVWEKMAGIDTVNNPRCIGFPKEGIKIIMQKLVNVIQENMSNKKRWFGFAD